MHADRERPRHFSQHRSGAKTSGLSCGVGASRVSVNLFLQDNRTGLPATLIHLANGMHLKAEYHLDFHLQSIHFKLCTKENRFIMFFFVPIKHVSVQPLSHLSRDNGGRV
ncbi:hypothetical protein TGME49_212937 [Toxoplasma gondii ME49]|uniref:Uncharacterized protein n=2 Tax=Toxoplasma gondii TaxID=5811 RepID=A0A2G8XYC5_TOXGO|nr:hypothetical protein TGME49_212937 [Toxoplasma gondii ME49]EPT31190.1 hypothetical protein TGME49_212937 [Toxoplasma gondii ME49]PIM00025.1 hypothetical protein TGCOUG_212937 [Toxoplasma gondii COUG]|eukprot:XP_018637865.1 hypothetical protein TGME49_212937 [Toxoplasma gondii ME49]